jgi:hypothetical protein
VITAFASSALGVAGTIGGAAVASVLTTVSGTVIRHSAHHTNAKLRRANDRLLGSNQRLRSNNERLHDALVDCEDENEDGPDPIQGGPVQAGPIQFGTVQLGQSTTDPGQSTTDPGQSTADGDEDRRPANRARWVAGTIAALAVFAIALGGITGAEALIGRPLSTLFGHHSGSGSSIGQLVGSGKKTNTTTDKKTKPTDAPTTPTAANPSPTGQPPADTASDPAPGGGDTGGTTGGTAGGGDTGGIETGGADTGGAQIP